MNNKIVKETKEEILEDLIKFIKNHVGKTWWLKNEINEETRLAKDLKLDGDDAFDFFEEFKNAYNIDISRLDLSNTFNSEGFDPLNISNIFSFNKKKKKHDFKDITINDLLEMVISNEDFE